jgi:HEPN domain-containing protein
MKKATREWIEKAEEDLQAAEFLAASSKSLHGVVCFHCQQCAEKYLKAVLEELSIFVDKTHDLKKLWTVLLAHYRALRSLRRGLDVLNRYSVSVRYPGRRTSKRQAQAALRWANKVRTACRAILGL